MTLPYPHNVVRLFADDMEANTGPIQGRIYVFILMTSWQGLGFPVVDVDIGVEEIGSEEGRGEDVEDSVESKEETVESIVVDLPDCVVPISGGKPEVMELKFYIKQRDMFIKQNIRATQTYNWKFTYTSMDLWEELVSRRFGNHRFVQHLQHRCLNN